MVGATSSTWKEKMPVIVQLKLKLVKKSNHLKSGLFEGWISNVQALAMAIALTIRKTDRTFLSRFQKGFEKMAAICMDFKWLGFWITGPIKNPDHLQPNLLLTI